MISINGSVKIVIGINLNQMKDIINKLLTEVDSDIADTMLRETKDVFMDKETIYKGYQLLPDPTNTILMWQELRDRRKQP